MLSVETLECISSVNIKGCYSGLGKARSLYPQEGSILIGLIITMVIMASLGAGMVYFTSTATFQELLANNHQRAYYAAESGGRYANALIRQDLAAGTPLTSSQPSSLSGVFTMANGDRFQITDWVHAPVSVTGGTTNYYTYSSVGIVGSGFLQVKRKLSFKIHPADQSNLPVPPPIPKDASTFDVPKTDLNIYYSPVDMAEVDIKDNPKVDNDNALNLKSLNYTMGLRWYSSLTFAQLDAIRAGNGGLLNYGIQVQNKDLDIDGSTPSNYNIFGISFRLDDSNDTTMTDDLDNMYGISFVKLIRPATKDLNKAPDWYKDYIHDDTSWNVFSTGTNAGTWFVVLWKRVFPGTTPTTYTPLAYQQLTSADGVCRDSTANGCTKIKYWATIMVYVEEIAGANKIKGYLSQPPTYARTTTDVPTEILWAEKDGVPNPVTVPSIFKPISWTVVTGSGATEAPVNFDGITDAIDVVTDSALTTANYTNYTFGNTSQTKAREIGLHIFYHTDAANQIYYDNLFIDLTPSGYGYVPGSGQVIVGP